MICVRQPRSPARSRTSSTSPPGMSSSYPQRYRRRDRDRRDQSISSTTSQPAETRSSLPAATRSQTFKVSYQGTHNALGLAKWKRARFLISSTSEVYGDPQVHPQPEAYWATSTRSARAVSTTGEALRRSADDDVPHNQQGVDTCIARISTPTGRACAETRPRDGDLPASGYREGSR